MKKTILSICFLMGMNAVIPSVHAALPSGWTAVSAQAIPSGVKQAIFPTQYELFQLDVAKIEAQLKSAGTTPSNGVILHLPVNGSVQELLVWRDNVMAPELQENFPNILSFTAVDPKNHAISAKLDLNDLGFGAMIFNPHIGTYVIDPYSRQSTDYYIGFFKRNLDRSIYTGGVCGVKDELMSSIVPGTEMGGHLSPSDDVRLMRANGSIRRTYRLAVTNTGEWASLITGGAPSVTAVMSAISTILNRCNGVFQRELSVKMELIANNNSVVYLDAETDPYTCDGEAHDCLIDQVQTNMNTVFPGATNYDIGHIFCTAGGGLAQLQSVCATGNQARGVSGVFNTADIHTIIHEMGHQMGTHHTFSANTGGCEGNGNESTAYEPGSGTSIMSYNNLCAPNDVTPPEEDYYHVASLNMITDYINIAPCGTNSAGYTPISINPLGQNYKIPRLTPFELIAEEATSYEPAPADITYNWEQYDLGNFGETESEYATAEEGPVFESRTPSVRRDRQFPDNELVASNEYTFVGQRLPNVERSMKFKLTNRSYFEGWGTFNYSENTVNIDVTNSNPFRVTGPSTTALYEVGAPILITWDTVDTRRAPINCGYVNIYMSVNGGLTFPFIVATNVPNMGSYNLSAPNVYSENIRFKVKGSGNIFYDIGKVSVRIHGEHVGLDPELEFVKDLKIYPNPTENQLFVKSEIHLATPLTIGLYALNGQKVYEGKLNQELLIDVSKFAKGIYMMHIWDNEKGMGKTEKIVIK